MKDLMICLMLQLLLTQTYDGFGEMVTVSYKIENQIYSCNLWIFWAF